MICIKCKSSESDGIQMNEYPDRWECDFCGYKIAKLHKTMTPSETQKIVQEMKEYHNKPKQNIFK